MVVSRCALAAFADWRLVRLRATDLATGKLVLRKRGPTGAVLPNKQRVNIFLDGAVIEHFKTMPATAATRR